MNCAEGTIISRHASLERCLRSQFSTIGLRIQLGLSMCPPWRLERNGYEPNDRPLIPTGYKTKKSLVIASRYFIKHLRREVYFEDSRMGRV